MGKSSLLIRAIDAAMKVGKQVAFRDFQLFDQQALTNADIFYRQFCTVLTEQLEIPNRTEEFWQQGAGNNQRCNRYMESYLLKKLVVVGSSVVVVMLVCGKCISIIMTCSISLAAQQAAT